MPVHANKTSFQKGKSGNPGGKPVNARNRLSNAFLTALADDFEINGVVAIERLRADKPEKYLELVAEVLPKEANVSIDQSGTVTHEHVAISEVSQRIAEVLRAGTEGTRETALPH